VLDLLSQSFRKGVQQRWTLHFVQFPVVKGALQWHGTHFGHPSCHAIMALEVAVAAKKWRL
jgi:hypothetical protein